MHFLRPRHACSYDTPIGDAGSVPPKGRPALGWGIGSPLLADNLPGWGCRSSILQFRVTQQHLLVIYSPGIHSQDVAAAVWLDHDTLQPAARLDLPDGVCRAWTDSGMEKALLSTLTGSVFTLPLQPQVMVSEVVSRPAKLHTLVFCYHAFNLLATCASMDTEDRGVTRECLASLCEAILTQQHKEQQ